MEKTENVLNHAHILAEKIYQLTVDLNYTGGDENDDDEIDAYVTMVNAREPLIKELLDLKERIDTITRTTAEYAEFLKCIEDIREAEKDHTAYFTQLHEEVRGSIKEIKKGRQINSAYNMDVMYDDAVSVDKKN
jgi:uncharacterized protein YllA (UPF0747 family)